MAWHIYLRDAKSVSLYPYNKSQILQNVIIIIIIITLFSEGDI